MNVVEEIYARNSERPSVPFRRTRGPLSLIRSLARSRGQRYPGLICEFKRTSPSGFTNTREPGIRDYFRKLESRKVAGFSVLTEPNRFLGSYDDISSVQGFNVPILDKDFISSEKMVEDAYNSGADAILLILDFLPEETVYSLAEFAGSLGLESLIEFHDLGFMDSIRPARNAIFGYNRRNLRTLSMDPRESEIISQIMERGLDVVLESGIDSAYLGSHDVSMFSGMLVGASILNGDQMMKLLEMDMQPHDE